MATLTGMKAKPGWWSLCLNLTVYFLFWGGSQITTHVVLSVTASRLQGNSLSSSRRPSICCCPFVSSSIHRSDKDSRLWRFLFLVFSPYVWPREAWLSRHISAVVGSSSYCNNDPNGCINTCPPVGEGTCGWRAHAAAPQQSNQWWHWCLIKGCFELSGVSLEWNSEFWLGKGRSVGRLNLLSHRVMLRDVWRKITTSL